VLFPSTDPLSSNLPVRLSSRKNVTSIMNSISFVLKTFSRVALSCLRDIDFIVACKVASELEGLDIR